MKTPYDDLRSLFERAHELKEQIRDGDRDSLYELNADIQAKKLGGKLIVLTKPDHTLFNGYSETEHSHLYPSGRLRSFAVQYDEGEEYPNLAVAVDDVRGRDGCIQFAVIDDDMEAYDVVREQTDSEVFADIKAVLHAPDFTFTALAAACKHIGRGNLNLALFAAAVNSVRLPSEIASAVYTTPWAVSYYTNGIDVGPAQKFPVRYELERRDMFAFMYRKQQNIFQTTITGMLPNVPHCDFKNIVVGGNIVGHDLA